MQKRDVLGRAPRHRVDDRPALGRAVGLLPECDEVRGVVREPHQRGRDAVERSARHHAQRERVAHRPAARGGGGGGGGGSPTTNRNRPPACSSSRRPSAAPTFLRTITIASFTLPSAPAIAVRASSRLTPHTSITIRSPRSCSFWLSATRSTIRLP